MDRLSASIVNSFVQALCYGIYITTFALCLRWLLYHDYGWKPRNKMDLPMVAISIFVFLLTTAGLGTTFEMTWALKMSQLRLFALMNTVNSAIEYTTFQVVDAVLIYRCWAVYGKSWRIICLPILFWISSVVLAYYDIYWYAVSLNITDPDVSDQISVRVLHIWDGFFACNIATNIYATSAIVYRILRVQKDSINTSGRRLTQTGRIIAESGVLYTVSTIINLIATVLVAINTNTEFFQVAADAVNFSLAGIAFNLIFIRVGQQRAATRDPTADSQFVATKGKEFLSTIQFHPAHTVTTTGFQEPSTPLSDSVDC